MAIRAAVMTAPHAPIILRDLPEPAVEPGGVVLDVLASEVCGTDVHLHHGRLAGVPYPIVPGHVAVGRVREARGVRTDALGRPLAAGDVVTFYDVHGICGRCWHCLVARQPNRCPLRRVYGITMSADEGPFGGWAERIHLKPGTHILRLPDALTPDDVIAGGCGLFTGHAAVERSALAMGDVVVVQGVGAVGLGATIFARLRGAGVLVSIGDPEPRLELANAFGADLALSLGDTTADARLAAVRDLTGGRGADVVIEASGNPAAVPEGLALLREGGTCVIAGHYTDAGAVAVNPHVVNRKHATVLGQWGTEFHHVHRSLELLARHRSRIPVDRIIGARYPLARAGEALEDLARLRVTKALIVPT